MGLGDQIFHNLSHEIEIFCMNFPHYALPNYLSLLLKQSDVSRFRLLICLNRYFNIKSDLSRFFPNLTVFHKIR